MIRLICFLILCFSVSSSAIAQRYEAPRPQIIVSPDRVDAWINQLQPTSQSQAQVNAPRVQRRQNAQRKRGFLFLQPQVNVAVEPRQNTRRRQSSSATIDGRRIGQQPTVQASVRTDLPRASSPKKRSIDPKFLPTIVAYAGPEAPGTIIVNTNERFLYLVQQNGQAKRYGVGVGREGFSWKGTENITKKAEWPTWRPPQEMIERERLKGRELPAVMEGGPENPLGARALYLGSTLYRIHGSNAPWSIGQAVSSGCIRMRNEDVIDLYERVGVGTQVKVI